MAPSPTGELLERDATGDATTADSDGGDRATLSPDDRYHLLQTSRRRETLRYLLTVDQVVEVGDLAEWVASREHSVPVEELRSSQRQRVYISLYQTHLPKLDAFKIVDYDKDRGRVERTERITQFEPYLGTATTGNEHSRRWWPLHGMTVLVCGAFLVGAVVGPLSLAGATLAAIVLTVYGIVTSIQALIETGLVSPSKRNQ